MATRKGLDPRQEAAVAAHRNAVVSAGAGSGKTTVLAERYARLVREGRAGVEEILTLTFTRKAAAEMHERIYALLHEDRALPGVTEQIALFDRAQISTFDSFCAQIARGWSQRYGVPPSFAVADEERGDDVEGAALEFVLRNWERPALAEFIRTNGFERVYRGLFVPVARSFLTIAEERDFLGMASRQLAELERVADEKVRRLAEILEGIRSLDEGAAAAIASAHGLIDRLPTLTLLVASGAYGDLREALSTLRLSKQTGRAASATVVEYKELVDAATVLATELRSVADTLLAREVLVGMFELLEEFQRSVLEAKRRSGLLTFRDIADLAVRILLENRPLRRFYKERFRYILVDEFQDNNELQKRLLYLLAERPESEGDGVPKPDELVVDKLFFVGDEKQSIYRFRGADVSVFKGLAEEISANGGLSLSLGANYRSRPEIIRFLNQLFARVLEGAAESYEARWEPLATASNGADGSSASAQASVGPEGQPAGERGGGPPVRLFYKPFERDADDPDLAENDDAEAWYIARFIHESVARERLMVKDGEGERPATYDDFALLLRSTGNQIRYERLFRRLGIPYATQSVRTLFLEAPLNDLYNLLTVVVSPEDRAAYAAVLRSPLVNLSDEVVARLLLDRRPPFAEEDLGPGLSAEDREKWRRGRALHEELGAKVDLVPIAELLRIIWYEYGYRYLLLRDRDYHGYLDYYDWFVRLAERADRKGAPLALFLDSIRPKVGAYERLPELTILREETRGVQLLTIHKAKGLEFPIVILANAGNSGRGPSEASEPYYLSERFGLTLRLSKGGNYFYEIAKEENRRKELAEAKRLLYVALTRARSHLIISGCHNRNNRQAEEAHLNMVFRALELSPEVLAGGSAGGGTSRRDRGAISARAARVAPALQAAPAAHVAPASGGEGHPPIQVELIPPVEERRLYLRAPAPSASAPTRAAAPPDGVGAQTAGPSREEDREGEPLPADPARSLSLASARSLAERYAEAPEVEWRPPRRSWSATALNAFARDRARAGSGAGAAGSVPRGEPLPGLSIDSILEAEQLEEPFGTLCHLAIERILSPGGTRPGAEHPPSPLGASDRTDGVSPPGGLLSPRALIEAIPRRLRELLPSRLEERLAEEAVALAARFLGSPLGEAALGAPRESECAFLYRHEVDGSPFFLSGKLDLLVQAPAPGPVLVVDFKSDRELVEGDYDVQMAIYRRAAAELTRRPVRCLLFYLRSARAVEVTDALDLDGLLRAAAEPSPEDGGASLRNGAD